MAKKETKTKTRAKTKPETNRKGRFVKVPIKYNIPDTISTKYVTNSTVQIMEEEFKISFFQTNPELCFDKNAKPPKNIQVDCVAAVIMTPNRIGRLIDALKKQLDAYNSQ